MTVTQPLRDERKELIPHIEALRVVADSLGDVPLEGPTRSRRRLCVPYPASDSPCRSGGTCALPVIENLMAGMGTHCDD